MGNAFIYTANNYNGVETPGAVAYVPANKIGSCAVMQRDSLGRVVTHFSDLSAADCNSIGGLRVYTPSTYYQNTRADEIQAYNPYNGPWNCKINAMLNTPNGYRTIPGYALNSSDCVNRFYGAWSDTAQTNNPYI